jgi:hypothetical protein
MCYNKIIYPQDRETKDFVTCHVSISHTQKRLGNNGTSFPVHEIDICGSKIMQHLKFHTLATFCFYLLVTNLHILSLLIVMPRHNNHSGEGHSDARCKYIIQIVSWIISKWFS